MWTSNLLLYTLPESSTFIVTESMACTKLSVVNRATPKIGDVTITTDVSNFHNYSSNGITLKTNQEWEWNSGSGVLHHITITTNASSYAVISLGI